MSGGPAGWLKGQRVKQVLNSRSLEISSVRPVENWDGARIRFDVEKRPRGQALGGDRVGRLGFFPSQFTQLNLLMDPRCIQL